jgi:hypothetical protein
MEQNSQTLQAALYPTEIPKFLHAALDSPANPRQHTQLVVRQQSWPTEPNDQHSYNREADFEAHVPPSSAGLYQEESRRAPFKRNPVHIFKLSPVCHTVCMFMSIGFPLTAAD